MIWLATVTFIFYSLNVTGFKVKNFVLVDGSCLKNEPVDMVYWGLFLASLITFWVKPEAGRWLYLGFLALGVVTLSLTTVRYIIWPDGKKTQSYNECFKTSHYIIKPSKVRVIPDTFHLVLLILMFGNFIGMIFHCAVK